MNRDSLQADFHDLISCSLAALEAPQTAPQISNGSTPSKCSEGIDSFLAGYRQMNSKANFDELIRCSIASLETLQPRNLGPSLKSSGSIDDFLAEYRHESSSIVSFLSCLEEPSRKDPKSSCSACLDMAHHCESKNSCLQPQSLAMNRPNEHVGRITGEEGKVLSGSSRKRTSESQPQSRTNTKRACNQAHDASKEERRRIKNCEYQRRFRERKLRLEMQQLWTATCARHVTFP